MWNLLAGSSNYLYGTGVKVSRGVGFGGFRHALLVRARLAIKLSEQAPMDQCRDSLFLLLVGLIEQFFGLDRKLDGYHRVFARDAAATPGAGKAKANTSRAYHESRITSEFLKFLFGISIASKQQNHLLRKSDNRTRLRTPSFDPSEA